MCEWPFKDPASSNNKGQGESEAKWNSLDDMREEEWNRKGVRRSHFNQWNSFSYSGAKVGRICCENSGQGISLAYCEASDGKESDLSPTA